jgi:hypothetical protein
VRWSLFMVAIVAEERGGLAAIRRSAQLVTGEWFRALGVLSIASLILGVLVSVPVSLVQVLVAVFDEADLGMSSTGAMIVNSATILCQVLFSSIGTVTYLLLFVDLRNRREGTDLLERVSSLERATP